MIYLNYAALSPTRPEVQREVETTLAEFQSLLYSDAGLNWYQEKISIFRNDVAELLNVSEPSSIAFVPNSSLASHLAFSFIDWQPGDIILTSNHENPSIKREIDWLAHRGVQVSMIKPTSPGEIVTTIEKQISTRQIKTILLSHVSHVDGRIFPVSEIGRMAQESGTLFIVDGAQAVGHIPVNLQQWDFDLYFFPGHKWCQGPLGTGVLIAQQTFLTKNPVFERAGLGWNGTRAARFEIGTHNIGLNAGLAKACKLLKEEGLKIKEQEKIGEMVRKSLEGTGKIQIQQWAGEHSPGIFTVQFQDPKNHNIMRGLQNQEDIVMKHFFDYPPGAPPAIRFSWSGREDIADISSAMKAIEKSLNTSCN